MYSLWLRRCAVALATCTFVLLVGGALANRQVSSAPIVLAITDVVRHLLFAASAGLAVVTSRSWLEAPQIVQDSGWPSLRSMALFCCAIVPVQIALGAGYRFHLTTVIPHVIGSIVVTAVILMVSIFVLAQFGSHPALRRSSMALLGITCLQIVLGILAFVTHLNESNAPVFTTGHLANGALTLAANVVLAFEVLRNVQPRRSEAAHLSPVTR